MPGRIARTIRRLLLVAGIGLLLWLPSSFWIYASVTLPGPAAGCGASIRDGFIELWMLDQHPFGPSVPFEIDAGWDRYHSGSLRQMAAFAIWPHINYEPYFGDPVVAVPIWMAAALALAWPVIAFMKVRRRGPQRGFAVESGGGASRPGPGAL